MAIEEVANLSTSYIPDVLLEAGKIAQALQALGLIIVLWVIFQIINFVLHRRRTKAVYGFKEDIKRIETKLNRIDRLLRNRR